MGSYQLSSQHAPIRGITGTDSPYERGQIGEQVTEYKITVARIETAARGAQDKEICRGFYIGRLIGGLYRGGGREAKLLVRDPAGRLLRPPELAASSVPSTNPPEEKNERDRNPAE
jgi:hypothetical protein